MYLVISVKAVATPRDSNSEYKNMYNLNNHHKQHINFED